MHLHWLNSNAILRINQKILQNHQPPHPNGVVVRRKQKQWQPVKDGDVRLKSKQMSLRQRTEMTPAVMPALLMLPKNGEENPAQAARLHLQQKPHQAEKLHLAEKPNRDANQVPDLRFQNQRKRKLHRQITPQ